MRRHASVRAAVVTGVRVGNVESPGPRVVAPARRGRRQKRELRGTKHVRGVSLRERMRMCNVARLRRERVRGRRSWASSRVRSASVTCSSSVSSSGYGSSASSSSAAARTHAAGVRAVRDDRARDGLGGGRVAQERSDAERRELRGVRGRGRERRERGRDGGRRGERGKERRRRRRRRGRVCAAGRRRAYRVEDRELELVGPDEVLWGVSR
jgi:hypothetical protein